MHIHPIPVPVPLTPRSQQQHYQHISTRDDLWGKLALPRSYHYYRIRLSQRRQSVERALRALGAAEYVEAREASRRVAQTVYTALPAREKVFDLVGLGRVRARTVMAANPSSAEPCEHGSVAVSSVGRRTVWDLADSG